LLASCNAAIDYSQYANYKEKDKEEKQAGHPPLKKP
jgi:hypothetical protein